MVADGSISGGGKSGNFKYYDVEGWSKHFTNDAEYYYIYVQVSDEDSAGRILHTPESLPYAEQGGSWQFSPYGSALTTGLPSSGRTGFPDGNALNMVAGAAQRRLSAQFFSMGMDNGNFYQTIAPWALSMMYNHSVVNFTLNGMSELNLVLKGLPVTNDLSRLSPVRMYVDGNGFLKIAP